MADNGEEVEVCRSFRNNGRCRFGDECKFEHSEGEPIEPPARRERGECFNFRDSGECSHGDRCRFSHGPDDVRGNNIEDEICRNFLRGRCNNGDDCRRKHEGEPVEAAPRRRRGKGGVCFAFRDDGNCERGDECQFSHNLDGDDNGEQEDAPRRSRPRRRNKGPGECYDFRDGNCERGDECRFTHGGEAGSGAGAPRPRGECYDFRDGTCERGDECKFSHGGDGEVMAERKPRASRPVVKIDEICNNYKEGKCRLGERCRRIHEDA